MNLPASEDSGRTPDNRRATSGRPIQDRNPRRVAACARQWVRCHTAVEGIRYGLSTFHTSSPQTTSMHATAFDKSPLKPGCVESQLKARGTITQFGSRSCQGRVARQNAEPLDCRSFRMLKNAGEPGQCKSIGPPEVHAIGRCFVGPCGNESYQRVQRRPVEHRELRQPHPH